MQHVYQLFACHATQGEVCPKEESNSKLGSICLIDSRGNGWQEAQRAGRVRDSPKVLGHRERVRLITPATCREPLASGTGSLLGAYRLRERIDDLRHDVRACQFVEDTPLVVVTLGERFERLLTPKLPNGEVYCDRGFWEVVRSHLVSSGSRFDAQPALQLAAFIEGQHHRGLEVQHTRRRNLDQSLQWRASGESFGHHFVVVSLVSEVE